MFCFIFDDWNSSDGQIVLRHGAGPDSNQIPIDGLKNAISALNTLRPTENHEHQTVECKSCDFFRTEIFNLRKQMAAMEREYNLKLSRERKRYRKIFKEKQMLVVKQLNQLANEVTFEEMVGVLLYSMLGERIPKTMFVSNVINLERITGRRLP